MKAILIVTPQSTSGLPFNNRGLRSSRDLRVRNFCKIIKIKKYRKKKIIWGKKRIFR